MRGFWIREPHQVRLLTPYVEAFKLAIHEAIPWRSRHFDWDSRTWIVKQPYVAAALEIAGEHYDEMRQLYLTEQPAATSSSSSTSSTSSASHDTAECLRQVRGIYCEAAELYLLPDAPLEVIAGAYRAMAKLAHPDLGGSHERMKAVNGAYETLRRRAEERRNGR